MKIKYKLLFISCLPMMFALVLAGFNIKRINNTRLQMSELLPVVSIVEKANNLIHELQKERGHAAGLIASGGETSIKKSMESQWIETDKKLKEFLQFIDNFKFQKYNPDFKKYVLNCAAKLETLNSTRMRIEEFSLMQALDYYTDQIEKPLAMLSLYLSKLSSDTQISAMASSYYSLLLYKENAGLEKAVLKAVFIEDRFLSGFYQKFVSLVSAQEIYRSNFMDMACLEHKKFFLKKSKSSFIDEVKRIRKIVYTNCNTGNFNISPNHWVDMINGKINLLKEVEIKISRELLESALKLKKKCQNELTLYIILIFVFTALILIFLYKIIFSITSPLEKLSMIAGKVSQGDMSSKASIDSNCEIGLLAKVFNEMIDNILERVKSEEQKKIKLADTMEKINLELDIAMRLQHELLPANFSDFPEVNIQCRFIPYRKVGGDLYDVWRLDKSKICFLIFDISGHGVAAALLTTVSKQSFRKNISSDLPIEKCVEKVNSELLSFFSDNQFLTAIVCVLETDKGVLTVCQCGHPTIYIHKRNTKKLIQTNECNCAIGFFEDWEFTSKSFSIDSGDRFYLYTDGLVDTKNMNKERYEHERLERIILSNELSFDKQVQGIMDDVDCFREDMDQADDLTLMCVELL